MRARIAAGKSLNNNFSDGIRDAFPLLSIKGKVFRVRVDGEEKALIDPATRQPIPFLDVVLVNAAPMLSKTYYAKGFTDGDMNPPDCWSLDSVKPDASVANKMAPLCGNCPMNAFGSRTTDNGKQAKACQDARRVAVVMPHQLDGDQQMMLLLRIPQSSLKNLKAYSQLLARHIMEPAACVTRLAFDYQEAFPKLLFNFVSPLTDEQYDTVVQLADADNTRAMLQAPDFEAAPSTQPLPNATGSMQGMPVQTAPVLEDATPAAKPVQQAPVMETVADPAMVASTKPANIITLPDGKLFDTATGQYVEVQAKMAEPVMDPATIKLPDGKYFNPVRGTFVTGPEVDAPAAQFAPDPVEAKTPEPAPAKKRTPPKKAAPETPPQQSAIPMDDDTGGEPAPEQQVSQRTNAGVKPASRGMEDLLAVLVPPSA
jgi:hypothetical protein